MPQPDPWNAQLYQQQHAFVWRYGQGLLELLEPRPGERILDLGCGTGELTEQLASSGASVLGIDASSAMIERARAQFPALEFVVADATALGYEAAFDAVFSNAALHWMRPPEPVAQGIARALVPGGRLVAEFGGKGNVQTVCDALELALNDEGLALSNPWYFPSVAEYAALLEASGFRVTLAQLYDRPRPLEGGEAGFLRWLEQFSAPLLPDLEPDTLQRVQHAAEAHARARLWDGTHWTVDYVRLRVVAQKI